MFVAARTLDQGDLRVGRFRLDVIPPPGDMPPPGVAERLAAIQRLRGEMYQRDGAIRATDLAPDGRHIAPLDATTWHLFVHDNDDVQGCIRINIHGHAPKLSAFALLRLAERIPEPHRTHHLHAMQAAINWSIEINMPIGEVGGWALTEEMRNTSAGLTLALAVYAICESLRFVALAAATARHKSNEMLIRLGGTPLQGPDGPLPPIYDTVYGCEMQILRFHWQCAPKYERMRVAIREKLREKLSGTTIHDHGGLQG